MNLHQRGADLITQLKDHLLEVLRTHPEAQPGGQGVVEAEIARRAGLHSLGTVELDHTCREMLSLLHKDGKIAPVEGTGEVRWRLIE